MSIKTAKEVDKNDKHYRPGSYIRLAYTVYNFRTLSKTWVYFFAALNFKTQSNEFLFRSISYAS